MNELEGFHSLPLVDVDCLLLSMSLMLIIGLPFTDVGDSLTAEKKDEDSYALHIKIHLWREEPDKNREE